MALEIERRFLVTHPGWRLVAGPPQALRQGYLSASPDGFTVRMRLRADRKAWLTLKAPAAGIARHEFEYDIPGTDAEELWALASHRVTKTRYSLQQGGGDWVVDCFEGSNSPLILAEVELEAPDSPLTIPDWCGVEITGDPRWSNAALAYKPFATWPKDWIDEYRPQT
jgi:CYTH domain-containing protein